MLQCVILFTFAHPDIPGRVCRALWAIIRYYCVSTYKNVLRMRSQVIKLAQCATFLNCAMRCYWNPSGNFLTVAINRSREMHALQLLPQLLGDASTCTNAMLLVVAIVVSISAYRAFNRKGGEATGTVFPHHTNSQTIRKIWCRQPIALLLQLRILLVWQADVSGDHAGQ